MHVYRLNFFTNNIDKYNRGQGHYIKRIFCFYIYHWKFFLQQTIIIIATKNKFKTMGQAVSNWKCIFLTFPKKYIYIPICSPQSIPLKLALSWYKAITVSSCELGALCAGPPAVFFNSALCMVKSLFAFEVVFLHSSLTSLVFLVANPKALILSVIFDQMTFFCCSVRQFPVQNVKIFSNFLLQDLFFCNQKVWLSDSWDLQRTWGFLKFGHIDTGSTLLSFAL